MIGTLSITLIAESILAIGYCVWQRKPIRPILLTSLCANIVTQSLLWIALNTFFQEYIITLLIAESLIWIMESFMLYSIRANKLQLGEAVILGLIINGFSFGIGWFLPT